jgi:hypothetical protein
VDVRFKGKVRSWNLTEIKGSQLSQRAREECQGRYHIFLKLFVKFSEGYIHRQELVQ